MSGLVASIVIRLILLGSKKTTPNVRRVLMSQKTFANHLADEEAAIAQQQTTGSSIPTRPPVLKAADSSSNPRRNTKSQTPSRPSFMSPVGDVPAGVMPTPAARDPLDDEPLLKVNVPSVPSDVEMDALLSSSPLSYNAARSAPPPPEKPQRHFCEICGYWGTIKCMKCGARICGLECKGAHDDGRCLKFYA